MAEHPLTGFWAVAPSTVEVGEAFELRLKCLCEPYRVPAACFAAYPRLAGPFNVSPRGIAYMDNCATRWPGLIALDGGSELNGPGEVGCEALTGSFPGDERALGTIPGLSFRSSGTYTVRVTDQRTGITGESNPIEVSTGPPELHLFWGDLHSQTYFSDGLRCPEELYHFARYEGFLDIFALADHCEWLTDAQWEYFTRVTNASQDPGRFVTLVGLEWTNSALGHRNVYYPGDEGPILRSNDATGDSLEKVYAAARAYGALVIPHHSANVAMGVKWDTAHDPEHVRLAEVYSVWGNSECPARRGNTRPIRAIGGEQDGQHVVDALSRGYKLGLVGGGDIHDGRPGDDLHVQQTHVDQYPLLYRQGTMGVWAKELTREAVWEALWNRRVFATTNTRTILRFEVAGAPMGQTVATAGPMPIRVHAASEVPIRSVEIIRNGAVAFRHEGEDRLLDLEFMDPAATSDVHYYCRLTRVDGEMAWSSPVWIEGRRPPG